MITVHLVDRVGLGRRIASLYRAFAAFYAGNKLWQGALKTLIAPLVLIAFAGALLVPVAGFALPPIGLLRTDWSAAPLWQFIALHLVSSAIVLGVLSCSRFWSHPVMQIRDGYVRSGHPTLGAVFLGGYWRKRPPCDVELSSGARQWLWRVLRAA